MEEAGSVRTEIVDAALLLPLGGTACSLLTQASYLYSLALRLRAWSNERLLVTLLFYRTVQVILEEPIDDFLVHYREA